MFVLFSLIPYFFFLIPYFHPLLLFCIRSTDVYIVVWQNVLH
ncbi:hypothetical protein [Wolbachia pipientis]|nr:hypothetical protein [Wolbachia pipientis]